MKMTRREALKTLALGAGAALLPRAAFAHEGHSHKPATPPPPVAPPEVLNTFTLPPLGYAFDALEPHLDAQTMQIHYEKHHASYVANLNKALAGKADLAQWSVEDLLIKLEQVPTAIRSAVRNHAGGHANHSLLWTTLKRDGAKAPIGELAKRIDSTFGSFASFSDKWTAAAMSVFGSGWAWLSVDGKGGLVIETSSNQDSPLTGGRRPLAGIDVWEHAYYLKFQNRRAEYVAAFAKVMDWDVISARYRDSKKG